MLGFLNSQRLTEKHAGDQDRFFLRDDAWLADTAVTDRTGDHKGAWKISLTFTHYKNPLQLLARKIITFYREKKAEMPAFNVRRQPAKDKRTLEFTLDDLSFAPIDPMFFSQEFYQIAVDRYLLQTLFVY